MDQQGGRNTKLLVFCSFGIFVLYFIYGIIQEKITKTRYGPDQKKFTFTLSLVFLQCIVNMIFAKLALFIFRESKSEVPVKTYAICAFTYIGAMFASNYSLQHVSYPTQVLGKSVKPIPVMILGVLWAKKRYPLQKYFFVCLITLGVLLFLWKDNQKGKTSEQAIGIGELFLMISLSMDGFTGGLQEELRSKYKVQAYNMMFNVNIWSTLYLIIALVATNEWIAFYKFALEFPIVLLYILAFGITSAIGQMFIFQTVSRFGPLMCSIVTTTRKFFTILASVIIFNNPMVSRQWLGTTFVFAGIILDHIYGKEPRRLKGQ